MLELLLAAKATLADSTRPTFGRILRCFCPRRRCSSPSTRAAAPSGAAGATTPSRARTSPPSSSGSARRRRRWCRWRRRRATASSAAASAALSRSRRVASARATPSPPRSGTWRSRARSRRRRSDVARSHARQRAADGGGADLLADAGARCTSCCRLCIEHKNSLKSITPDASKSAWRNMAAICSCAYDAPVMAQSLSITIANSFRSSTPSAFVSKLRNRAAALSSSPGVSEGTCHGGRARISGGRKRGRCGV